jgi:hypothetical protein
VAHWRPLRCGGHAGAVRMPTKKTIKIKILNNFSINYSLNISLNIKNASNMKFAGGELQ